MIRFGNGNVPYQLGSSLTATGKKLLSIYAAIYVLELLLEHWLHRPVVSSLQLYPLISSNFQVWQLITHPLIHDPRSPVAFLICCIVFYFFAGPVEHAFGKKRFLTFFYLSAMMGALCGLCFSVVAGFNTPFMGMMPSLLSMIVAFGLINPESTILLLFIIPLKAKYLSYGTIIVTALTFLAKANPHGAYHLGGMLFGYLYVMGIGNLLDLKTIYLKLRAWQLRKKRPVLKVVEGNDGGKHDRKPTYH